MNSLVIKNVRIGDICVLVSTTFDDSMESNSKKVGRGTRIP